MLTLNGITLRLGGRVVLDRASAAVPARARVGLVGRNGAGKSTLLKVIAGFAEADSVGGSAPVQHGCRTLPSSEKRRAAEWRRTRSGAPLHLL
jgi:ATP-binding cassette subfamily F protein 3